MSVSSLEGMCCYLEALLQQILAEIKSLKNDSTRTKEAIKEMTSDIRDIRGLMKNFTAELENSNSQQAENTDIIRAILYNMEEFNAKLDGLTLHTASKEALNAVATKTDLIPISEKLNQLTAGLATHETEIRRLKAVK